MSDVKMRIGFVDYHLDNFHANVYLAAFHQTFAERGFRVTACTALRRRSGRDWAREKGVPWFDSVEAMDPHVDAYMVLAPSNPETHLDLCRAVFPFGKIAYVDKTFAPNVATARKIFRLADRHRVPVQTTSALRYTPVQRYVREVGRARVRHMVSWGGGRSFGEYAIHPVELVVSCMGPNATALMRRGTGNLSQLLVDFTGGRTAVINVFVRSKTPYAASVTTAAETRHIAVDGSRLFLDTAEALIDFFESGKPNIPRAESLMVRRILDVAAQPRALKRFVPL